jgi:uncharacterized protein (TIGR02594 family)
MNAVAAKDEPSWLTIAKAEIGVREGRDDARIAEYLSTVGASKGDAWCSAFLEWVMRQAGHKGPGKPTARAWRHWFEPLKQPSLGCLVVLWRNSPLSWQGHVGLWVGETASHFRLLGGNQDNQVCTKLYPKSQLLSLRMP